MKTKKKLVLSRETVRSLGTTDLGKVAGGSRDCITYWCQTSNGPYVCGQVCHDYTLGSACIC